MYSIFDEQNKKAIKEQSNKSAGFLNSLSSKLGTVPQVKPPVLTTPTNNPYFKDQNALTPEDLNKKAKFENSALGKIGNFFGSVAETGANLVSGIVRNPEKLPQGLLREAASVGISAGRKIFNKPDAFVVPQTKLEKFFFGKEAIGGIGDEAGVTAKQSAQEIDKLRNLPEGTTEKSNIYKYVGLPIIAGSTLISDLFTGGSESALSKGMKVKLLEDATEQSARKTMQVANFSNETIDKYAPEFARTTEKKALNSLYNEALTHEIQVVKNKAANRLAELDSKAKGEVIDAEGKVIDTKPQVLSADELAEQNYLKKHADDPAELSKAFKPSHEPVPEPKEFDNVSKRKTSELTTYENADDISRVNEYKAKIQAGEQIDPLIVMRDSDGKLGVEDGKHRLEAYKQLGIDEVPVTYKKADTVYQKAASKIDETDRALITEFIDTIREGKKVSPDATLRIQNMAEAMKLPNIYGSTKKLASDLGKVLDADREFTKARIAGNQVPNIPEGQVYKDEAGQVDQVVNNRGDIVYDKNGTDDMKFGDEGAVTPKKAKQYNAMREGLSKAWKGVVETVQDRWVKVNDAIKGTGKINAEDNPYIAEAVFHGRLATRVEKMKSEVKDIVFDVEKKAKAAKVDSVRFNADVNEYLISKHAAERNAKLGEKAAGITDEQAAKNLERIEALPYSKEIKETAKKIQDLNKQTLDILYADGNPWGLIDKEQYDTLKGQYKDYVPLNRIVEGVTDTEIGSVLSGKGMDVRGSGLKRAKGSDLEVSDILGNVAANVTQAITRAEKNLVNYDFYKIATETPNNGWVKTKPRIPVGRDFEGKIIFKDMSKDPHVMQMMVDGKPKFLEFTDPKMAETVRGIDTQYLPSMLSFVGTYSRLLSNLATRFNPEFWITNKFRDVQDAMIFASSQGKLNAAKQLGRQVKLEGERAILDHLRGKDTPGAKLYKQMLEDGGTTGGMSLSTKKQVELDIDKLRTLASSKPRQAFEAIANKIDQTNEVIENSTRYTVYKQALERGASRKEAAYLAKESTVNFNRKGKAGPVINALYMFSNASIQGAAKTFKALKNPKTLAYTVGTITAATFAINEYNESIDPEWRNKISDFERNGGVTILLPGVNSKGEHNRIVVPLAYSVRFIKAGAEAAYDASKGEGKGVGDAIGKVASGIADGYNPLGGNDLGSTLTPTIADLPREVGLNKKWSGSKIYPDYDPNLPDSRKYYDSLGESKIGKGFIALTKTLSDKANIEISPATMDYVLTQLTSGTGTFGKKVVNSGSALADGKKPSLDDIPFASRFLKEGDPEALDKYGNRQDKGDLNAVKSEQSKATFDRQQEAKSVISDIKGKPREEVAARLGEIAKNNKPLADEIIKQIKEEAKGFSTEDKQIRSLDIKNGGRAKYISRKLERLESAAEKKQYLLELADKKLITAEVLKQIAALQKESQQ